MTSDEVLAYLSASLREHNLQSAIRNMLDDKVWRSVVVSPNNEKESFLSHTSNNS